MEETDRHAVNSVLRERIVEHVFIGEVLRRLWQRRIVDVEILRSEFDSGGYDLVLSHEKIVRHIQFKTTRVGGKRGGVSLNLKLAEKPSGCVIWVVVTESLSLDHYLWFGAEPGEPLPMIADLKVTKHHKANALGVKTERPLHRQVGKARFEKVMTLDELLAKLFGPMESDLPAGDDPT